MNEPQAEIERVRTELLGADPEGTRFSLALRRAYDQIYDHRNTGRFRWDDLHKTEKMYFGSFVEISLQKEFSFEDGVDLDVRIAGVDVACMWSQTNDEWKLPPAVIGHICLLVKGSNERPVWSAGLIRAEEPLLNIPAKPVASKTLNASGHAAIHWIWKSVRLPESVLS